MSNADTPKSFQTVPQLAEELGVSERHLWNEVRVGELMVHKFGRKTRISPASAAAYKAAKKRDRKAPDQTKARRAINNGSVPIAPPNLSDITACETISGL
jgi:hypothetical protein